MNDLSTSPATLKTTSTRTGKIARLPLEVRQQLNIRLADGESAQDLVAWLNALPAVQERLARYYESRPVTEQNLSDWKQGGFLDWERHQEARAGLREFLSEAEELGDEAGDEMLADRVVNLVTTILLRFLREAASAETGLQHTRAVVEIARELSRLRQGDHERQRLRMLAERHRLEIEEKQEAMRRERESGRMLQLAGFAADRGIPDERLGELARFYREHEAKGRGADGDGMPDIEEMFRAWEAKEAEAKKAESTQPEPTRRPAKGGRRSGKFPE